MARLARQRHVTENDNEEEGDQMDEEALRNSQRPHRQAPSDIDSDDSAIGNGATHVDNDMDVDGEETEGSHDQLVKKLVRYALACEYSRAPIKRDGIRDKVFGRHKAPFKQVFDAAQKQLRNKFGMEMVELPVKEKVTLRERRAAAQKASQMPLSSRSYILISTLPKKYRDPVILAPSIVPTTSTEASYTGFYTLIVTLITLSGGTLADAKLDRYLKRMNADVNLPMDKTEAVLQKMIKQGYLIRIRDNVSGEEITEWMVGPRGKVELGRKGIMGLVLGAYGDTAPAELEERLNNSMGQAPAKGPETVESNGSEQSRTANNASSRRTSGRRRPVSDVENLESDTGL